MQQLLFISYRRKLIDQALYQHLPLLNGRVLDLGGGKTRGVFPPGKSMGWIVLDEDVSLKPSVTGDAHKLPFRADVFDAVKSSDLTGYLVEPVKMIKEVARVLKPGGNAVITAPFLTPFDHEQHDATRLTSAWWQWAAKASGLRVIKIESQGYFFTVLADFSRYWTHHWWLPLRYLAYLIVFPLHSLLVWLENKKGVPNYLKRFTTGFLVILKKPHKRS